MARPGFHDLFLRIPDDVWEKLERDAAREFRRPAQHVLFLIARRLGIASEEVRVQKPGPRPKAKPAREAPRRPRKAAPEGRDQPAQSKPKGRRRPLH